VLAALVCLGGFEGGSKIGDRRSYSIAAIACLFGTAARLAFAFFARSIKSIVECFNPGQSVVRPSWMREDEITDALDASRRQRTFIPRRIPL
jgi:hypothetical protein